jgi:DMSO/TMAO reductase YedYZ molybdopterin-dependent catalytic subunit
METTAAGAAAHESGAGPVEPRPGGDAESGSEPAARPGAGEPATTGTAGSKWYGVLLGLLATGAGLAAAELVAGMVRDTASPVVPVGQVFIDWVPPAVKDWAIEVFGTADKAVLVIGALAVILGLGALIGVLAIRGERAAAYALTSGIGVVGAFAVIIRPDPSIAKLLPTIVGAVVSLLVLWWLSPRRVTDDVGRPVLMGVDRRQFLFGAAGIGGAAILTGGLGRMLRERFEVGAERDALVLPEAGSVAAALPGDASLGVDGIESFVVPNDDFYRIDTALVVPQVSKDSWNLKIHGLVDNEIEMNFDDLLARPQVERYVTLSCVSNPIGGDLVGNALWQGVLLSDIFEEAGLQDGAEQVVSRSVDGWTCGTPIEAIMDGRDAMLAVAMNGEPLPARHGYPVRMVVPGLYGYVSATKWVTDIRLTRWDEYDAYWISRGWSKRGPVKTMTRIDTPRNGSSHSGEVAVGGVAWAVHRGISAVQVRFDEGEWLDADLGGVPSDDTWVQWVYRYSGPPGRHVVEARAIDGEGEVQPEEPAPVAPNGAQGYHRVTFELDPSQPA